MARRGRKVNTVRGRYICLPGVPLSSCFPFHHFSPPFITFFLLLLLTFSGKQEGPGQRGTGHLVQESQKEVWRPGSLVPLAGSDQGQEAACLAAGLGRKAVLERDVAALATLSILLRRYISTSPLGWN